jgi:hypothetical protein
VAEIILTFFMEKTAPIPAGKNVTLKNGSAWFLVGPPDFKSGVPSAEGGGWVRFPCTSAKGLR